MRATETGNRADGDFGLPELCVIRGNDEIAHHRQLATTTERITGYGRNHLLPQGMALLANKANIRLVEDRRKVYQAAAVKAREEAEVFGKRIAAMEVTAEHYVELLSDDPITRDLLGKELPRVLTYLHTVANALGVSS